MIGIDPLDMKAMQDHHDRQLAKLRIESDVSLKTSLQLGGIPTAYCGTSQDKRVIDLVAFFNSMDERGRVTLMRMAQVMPKNDSTKEICR